MNDRREVPFSQFFQMIDPLALSDGKGYNILNMICVFMARGIKLMLMIALGAVISGCFSIESGCLKATGEEHVLVSNYGWYLFHFIPIACGNANSEGFLPWVVFRNDVTMDKVQHRFMDYNQKKGGLDVVNLSYNIQESVLFEIPGSNLPIPLPYILSYKEIQLSAVLCPRPESVK